MAGAATSLSAASDGEVAVAAMLDAARHLIDAMQQGDEPALAARVQALHAAYEQQWSRVRQAAEALDTRVTPNIAPVADTGDEARALRQERHELRRALAARNLELKEQIDCLRQLLSAVQQATV